MEATGQCKCSYLKIQMWCSSTFKFYAMNFSFSPTQRPSVKASRNALFTLTFYSHQGQWVFDDERRDIYVEPLVCGADDVFDVLSGRHLDPSIIRCNVSFLRELGVA